MIRTSEFVSNIVNSIHHVVARSAILTHTCVKIRNQVNSIVGYHLGESADANLNGEFRLLNHLAPQCCTFVDVGANVGEWSGRLPIDQIERAILFEPSLKCMQVLQMRFSSRQFELHDAALSDVVGEANFVEEDGCGEGSALVTDITEVSGTRVGATIRKVRLTTLDNEMDRLPNVIDFLKIDTEGSDARVIYGSRRLLTEGRIRFLQFEYNSHWLTTGSTLHNTTQFLAGLGYECFLVKSSGLHRLNYARWGEFYRYSNFFACRISEVPAVSQLIGPVI
jgi:FkbM family methyltransferase